MVNYQEMKVENLIFKDENHNVYELTVQWQSAPFKFLFNEYHEEEQVKLNKSSKVRTDVMFNLGLSIFEEPDEEIINLILENMQ